MINLLDPSLPRTFTYCIDLSRVKKNKDAGESKKDAPFQTKFMYFQSNSKKKKEEQGHSGIANNT